MSLYEPMPDPHAETDDMWPDGPPSDYEVCGTCGFDHAYDGCDPAIYREMMRLHKEDGEDDVHAASSFEHRTERLQQSHDHSAPG